MNRHVLMVGMAAVLIMLLVPPYYFFFKMGPRAGAIVSNDVFYGLLWLPPEYSGETWNPNFLVARLAMDLLVIQLLVAVILTVGLGYFLARRDCR